MAKTHKIDEKKYKNTILFYHIIESLDNINDTLKESARMIVNLKIKISKDCENIIQRINVSLEDYYTLFYKFDFKLVEKLSSERYSIIENIEQLSKKLSKDEIRLLMNMERIIEEILNLKIER